jgi:hypothetical protein
MWRQGIHGGGVVSRGFGHCPRPKFLHGFPFTTDSLYGIIYSKEIRRDRVSITSTRKM